MTRIGVVSDTHLPRFGRSLPRALVDGFEGAGIEMVLHLGDFTEAVAPALFEAIAPLEAVAGNNDGPELVARFGRRRVIEVDGVRIGMTHGDLGTGATTPERARRTFAPDEVAVIVFGHSHVPLLERPPGGPLLLNPGSPTDKRRQPRYTWGLLEVREGAVLRAEVRAFDRR